MSLQVSRKGLAYRAKDKIQEVSDKPATEAEMRLHDRLSSDPNPDAGGKNFKECLNPNSKEVITAYLE